MRDLRSPVFLHVDGGRILINLIVWLGERKTRRAKQRKLRFAGKTRRAVTGKTWKTGICP